MPAILSGGKHSPVLITSDRHFRLLPALLSFILVCFEYVVVDKAPKLIMKIFRRIAVTLLVTVSFCLAPAIKADRVDIQVYKGQLRIIIPEQQTRNTLRLRYRSKTREVLRIKVDGLTLTNMRTKQFVNLNLQSASLVNIVDREGYWNTDIVYSDLDLGRDEYRIEGRLSLYLVDEQRTSDFSEYLMPEASNRPADSSIDWGLEN